LYQQVPIQKTRKAVQIEQCNQAPQEAKAVQELTHARTSLLLERLPTGVILVAAENAAITVINRRAMEILEQLSASIEPFNDSEEACTQAIGKNCEQLLRNIPIHNASGAPIPYEEHPLHKALIYGQTAETELQMTRKDGQTVHLLINTAPLYTPDGTLTSVILVLQEITRIKTLERAREDFFTTMAHELKTPLANIRAHLSALLTNDLQWSSEEQHDFLQTADEQVERLVDMINQFLDASRVEAGALHLELEPILIPELFEDLQDRLEALINSSQRSLRLDVPPQLPAIRGDYELIISVLTNLLSNAFRYAPEGDVVELTAQAIFDTNLTGPCTSHSPVSVRLSVADRGPGISEEQQAILFTRFSTFAAMSRPSIHRPGQPVLERRQKSERWSPATGLGLYISRGIVEAHGSKLTLISSAGQGATFSFILPVFTDKRKHQ
jgi:signal transduction histidine kinase